MRTMRAMQKTVIGVLALALAALACVAVWPKFQDPVTWTPDALYYQARLLEIRGEDQGAALKQVFQGPISAELRARDPQHTGSASWVKYNEPFYERRVSVPLAGAALYPVAGDRSLLYLSLAGYVASILALFGLLLLRFRLAVASVRDSRDDLSCRRLSSTRRFPLTDSWGLALEIVALRAPRCSRSTGASGGFRSGSQRSSLLAFTRDSTWIPVLAVGWCAVRYRSRVPVLLFATGIAAALPALLLFRTPVRELLALLVNNSEPSRTRRGGSSRGITPARHSTSSARTAASCGAASGTPASTSSAALQPSCRFVRRDSVSRSGTLMGAGAVLAVGYVLAAPAFSAFRLELVFVPMAAYGLALLAELAASRSRRELICSSDSCDPRTPVLTRSAAQLTAKRSCSDRSTDG